MTSSSRMVPTLMASTPIPTLESGRSGFLDRCRLFLEMVRFSHTIFALPFALLALVWALVVPSPEGITVQNWSPLRWIGILVCMVTARNFAMSINRWSDAEIDAKNPRTASRHIPSGKLTANSVLLFGLANATLFVLTCFLFIPNWLPVFLSIPVLAFLGGYSFAKRFTSSVHFWLGASLMLAPICTWIAVRGEAVQRVPLDLAPALWLGGAVLLWVAGFDILYACQDETVDRKMGLRSVASLLGTIGAFRVSALCHGLMVVVLATLGWVNPDLHLGWLWTTTIVIISGMLIYEHSIVSPEDLSRINLAFFHLNAIIGILIGIVGSLDAIWR